MIKLVVTKLLQNGQSTEKIRTRLLSVLTGDDGISKKAAGRLIQIATSNIT